MKVAFLATDMVEQVELTRPWEAVEEQGWTPELVSLEKGSIQGVNHFDRGDQFPVDRTVEEVSADDYDALVVPGGVANPDMMRTNDDAVGVVREFFEQGKPVGVICHGPWTLIDAGVADGRTMTSWPSVRTDLENAGVTWVYDLLVYAGYSALGGTGLVVAKALLAAGLGLLVLRLCRAGGGWLARAG